MKLILLCLLSLYFITSAQAGYREEYLELKSTYEDNGRKIREAQDKISELNTTWNHFWREDWVNGKLREQFRRVDDLIEEQKSIRDRIRFMENAQMVRMWSQANGVLSSKFVRLNQYLECDCDMVQYGDDLFTDIGAVQNLGNQRRATAAAASYIGKGDPYISKCLKKNPGTEVNVNYSSRDLCKRPDSYHGTTVKYKLRNDSEFLTLEMNLNLSYVGEAANKAESQKRINQARNCVELFYGRYGINLKLTFDTNSSHNYQHHHSEITLRDNFPRANSSNWATHRTVGRDLDESSVCALIVHEMGHNLGLPDTYADPDCPDRGEILPYPNVMSNSNYNPDDLEFNPEQIKSILGPLCR